MSPTSQRPAWLAPAVAWTMTLLSGLLAALVMGLGATTVSGSQGHAALLALGIGCILVPAAAWAAMVWWVMRPALGQRGTRALLWGAGLLGLWYCLFLMAGGPRS